MEKRSKNCKAIHCTHLEELSHSVTRNVKLKLTQHSIKPFKQTKMNFILFPSRSDCSKYTSFVFHNVSCLYKSFWGVHNSQTSLAYVWMKVNNNVEKLWRRLKRNETFILTDVVYPHPLISWIGNFQTPHTIIGCVDVVSSIR